MNPGFPSAGKVLYTAQDCPCKPIVLSKTLQRMAEVSKRSKATNKRYDISDFRRTSSAAVQALEACFCLERFNTSSPVPANNTKYSMSGSPKADANRSQSGTELSSSMIVDGFKAGLLARAHGKLSYLDEAEVHMKANHPRQRAGDIDLKFMVNDTVDLFDLIPMSLARIQGPNTTFYAGTTIYVEVTARTGESVLFTSPSEPVSHLAKKINFYNTEVPEIYDSPSFVMYVYNGSDPARVHEAFTNTTKYFDGVTIHFPRKDVAAWPEYERAEAEGRRAEAERARADAAFDLAEEHKARADAEKSRADANQLRIHELELLLEAARRHHKE